MFYESLVALRVVDDDDDALGEEGLVDDGLVEDDLDEDGLDEDGLDDDGLGDLDRFFGFFSMTEGTRFFWMRTSRFNAAIFSSSVNVFRANRL